MRSADKGRHERQNRREEGEIDGQTSKVRQRDVGFFRESRHDRNVAEK